MSPKIHSKLKSGVVSFRSIWIMLLASDSMAIELKPQRTQNSKAVRIANISAAATLRHSLPPEPSAAYSKPAKSRATHPTPAYKVSLRQAVSVFTLIVPKAGFVHSPDLLAGTRDDSLSVG
ncbi:hypothetical protein ACFX16_041753 [Malus domestica]